MFQISINKRLTMPDGIGPLSIETSIEKGEFVIIFGKSGVGKTSLLRMIAGLMRPESGVILADNEVWFDTDRKIDIPVQKRKIGFVFQDLALFPNMSVLENIQYAIKGKPDINKVTSLLKMVHLENLANRKPDTLSGGQRQRVALIRALAGSPELLLLDEPFSALDREMHHQLRKELYMIHKNLHLTTLLVTHDLADVYHLADKVIVIEQGSIVQSGTPNEVFGVREADDMLRVHGEIIQIKKSGVIHIAEILTGNTITRLVISEEEKSSLRPGMQVLICSGAFDPVIRILQ